MIKSDVSLWRSVRQEQFPGGTMTDGDPAPGILFPDFVPKPLPDGTVRNADVHQFKGADGTDWITNEGGTSLFDRDRVFPGRRWQTFCIPKGTVVPDSIKLQFDGWRERFQANHYLILPTANTMRSDAYRGALENLARNAVVRSIELTNSQTER
jgi:hypothetical protein